MSDGVPLIGWQTAAGRRRGFLLLALTAVVLWLLFRRTTVAPVVAALREIDARTWIAAFGLTLSFPLLSALRWRASLRAIGHRVPFLRCLTIILGTAPVSAIAPSKAGELLKALAFRGEIGILEVSGTVLAERALDVALLAGLAAVGGILAGEPLLARVAASAAGGILLALLLLPLLVPLFPAGKLRSRLARVVTVLTALRAQRSRTALIVLTTCLNWLASVLQTHLLLVSVGASVTFGKTLTVLPIAIFVGLLPVTFGGIGTRDAALIALLSPEVALADALTVGLLYSFFGYIVPALLGLPFLRAALFLKKSHGTGGPIAPTERDCT